MELGALYIIRPVRPVLNHFNVCNKLESILKALQVEHAQLQRPNK